MGRILGIVWVLFGSILVAMYTASITSTITSEVVSDTVKLYGTKVQTTYREIYGVNVCLPIKIIENSRIFYQSLNNNEAICQKGSISKLCYLC